jgi:Uma2 family endonuclease
MSSQPVTLAPEEYLELDRANEFRSEYANGEMFAMVNPTWSHSRVGSNTQGRLSEQLRGSPCEDTGSEARIFISKFVRFTLPDIVVTCGPPKFYDGCRDTIMDATFIVEVLSPSTKNYDRSEKFELYRSLPSFAEYLLLAQDATRAEHHVRQPDASWLFREFTEPAAIIELKTIGCRLELQTLYERVQFDAEVQAPAS